MAISTYSELQTAVSNWLDRSDLTSRIPEFIDIAESYINDDLRVKSMITSATVTPSQSVSYVALPTGFKEAVTFVDDNSDPIIQVHHEDLQEMLSTSSGKPQYYSVTNQINFDCVADASYSYTMTYYKGLDIATDLTNSVLTDYPNIYLYGTLIQAEPFLKNEKRVDVWYQLYNAAVKKANNRAADSLKKLRTDHPCTGGSFDIVKGY